MDGHLLVLSSDTRLSSSNPSGESKNDRVLLPLNSKTSHVERAATYPPAGKMVGFASLKTPNNRPNCANFPVDDDDIVCRGRQSPAADADPLAVRRIEECLDPTRLHNLQLYHERSPCGSVWSALLDASTPVRIFGLASSSGGDRHAGFVGSLLGALRKQVLLAHSALVLARPIGVVHTMPPVGSDDDRRVFAGLVYRCETQGVAVDLTTAVNTVVAASQFLDNVIVADEQRWRLGIVAPSFFLGDGSEVACWGLIGAVNGLWLDPASPFLAPELVDTAEATEASDVFALATWAIAVLGERVTGNDVLRACVECEPPERPSVVCALYAILAEVTRPGDQGWSWVHYASAIDDVKELRRCRDLQLADSAEVPLINVACQHGSAKCVAALLEAGCLPTDDIATATTMACALEGGNIEVVNALVQAGVSGPDMELVARVTDAVFFGQLLDHCSDPDALYLLHCVSGTPSPVSLAALARKGVSLRLIPGAARSEDLADAIAAARELTRVSTGGVVGARDPTLRVVAMNGGRNESSKSQRGALVANRPSWIRIIARNDLTEQVQIGFGAFGVVYKASLHGEWVAVKDVVTKSEDVLETVFNEVAVLARIRHRAVLLVLGLTEDPQAGTVGIVFEYMDGGDLAAKIKEAREACGEGEDGGGTFPAGMRAKALRQAAEGIAFLHSQGIVHRDIKPANILLTASGGAKIGDLGLAAEEGGREGLTRAYAAPEVFHGDQWSSFASDVYSFALTVYETMHLVRLPSGQDRVTFETRPPWDHPFSGGLPTPTGWLGDLVAAGLAVDDCVRPAMDAWADPLGAIEVSAEIGGSRFLGTVALQRWDQVLAFDVSRIDPGAVRTTPLHLASALDARPDVIEACAVQQSDVNAINADGLNPLMVAASAGVVTALIQHNACVDDRSGDGRTALMIALQHDRTEVATALIDKGADVNLPGVDGLTALMCAAQNGHVDVVNLLLDRGSNVNATATDGWTALMHSANAAVVEALVAGGADMDAVNCKGGSALIVAVQRGELDVVKALVNAGANSALMDNQPWTAMSWASKLNRLNIRHSLAGSSRLADIRSEEIHVALVAAVSNQSTLAVKTFLENGANPNRRTADGVPLLVFASKRNYVEGVKLLLRSLLPLEFAAVARRDSCDTALVCACRLGHVDVALALLRRWPKELLDGAGDYGLTPLMHAYAHQSERLTRKLLKHGASPDVTDADGVPLTALAALDGRWKVLRRILKCNPDGIPLLPVPGTGETALHIACRQGAVNQVAWLLKKWPGAGELVDMPNAVGNTPAWIAFRHCPPKRLGRVLDLVLPEPAMVNALSADGRHLLVEAAFAGNTEVAGLLLKRGGDGLDVAAAHLVPFIACQDGNVDLLRCFLKYAPSAMIKVNAPLANGWALADPDERLVDCIGDSLVLLAGAVEDEEASTRLVELLERRGAHSDV